MLWICRCQSCDKELGCNVEGFDGKNVWMELNFTRHYKMCNECKHMDSSKNSIWFCSLQCLKDYVMDPECLDQYFEDEIMWKKFERAVETGEPV